MKLATYSFRGSADRHLAIVEGEGVIALSANRELPVKMADLIARWDEHADTVRLMAGSSPICSLDAVVLHAPIERPGKIMGIGLNYADHIAESELERPDEQMWFAKQATCIADPFGPIELPRVSDKLDYEGELVFVIGRRIRHATTEEARGAIFGFCCGNDVSVRDWQFKTSQFNLGKSFDTHAPYGPWIVTADELDPHDLAIRTYVNDEMRQNSNTRHLIFDLYDQVAHLSQAMTLEPGDIFFSGTPHGVGAAMKPPRFLKAGDVVRVEIDGIGKIENTVCHE